MIWGNGRGMEHKDSSRKFYRKEPLDIDTFPGNHELFFNDYTLRRLREEVENLDKNCREFHFWMSRSIAQKGTIFVSSAPLCGRSRCCFAVLPRPIPPVRHFQFHLELLKYGPEWTLREILATHTEMSSIWHLKIIEIINRSCI